MTYDKLYQKEDTKSKKVSTIRDDGRRTSSFAACEILDDVTRVTVTGTGDPAVRSRIKLRLKSMAGHVGLLMSLAVYCAVGGMVFRALEQPAETLRQRELKLSMQEARATFLGTLRSKNLTIQKKSYFDIDLDVELKAYEQALEKAVSEGFRFENASEYESRERWNILQAVFFSSTVLTTIGYGNIVPETLWGRVFCIPFAMIGIPLTLTVVADWGRLFASAVSRLARHLPEMPECCRKRFKKPAVRRSFYVFGAICALCLYLAAGAGVFLLWEKEWTFFDGFYFCFVTMTTIGFGDLVPTRPNYMLLCTLYILIGMALTSTFIELIRRQYAESWRRIAQAMSGPLLAEGLRKLMMAQTNTTGLNTDVAALQRILTVSMPRRTKSLRSKTIDQQDWEDAMRAVLQDIQNSSNKQIIQIVVYESSV